MNEKKNLILGFAKGYNWYILEPFVRSFIKNIPNADMVLFMENYSDFTRYQLEQVKNAPSGGKIIVEPVPAELRDVFPANSRWKFSADYIDTHGEKYGQIFLSDTRDVIFQKDLFECYKNYPKYLACAEEDFAGYIRSDKTVCEWIRDAYGEDELKKMADKFMYCPSTVAGTYEEIKIFARKMWDYMPRNVDFYGLDLATECYIMYNNLVPVENIMEVRCHEGEILSSFWFHVMNPIKFDGEKILRGDGGVPAVVHQYDRHEKLVNLVDKIYREPLTEPNENFTDVQSSLDQFFHLAQNENSEIPLKFFMNYLEGKKVFSRKVNDLIDVWKMLLKRENPDLSTELFEIAIQREIISASENNFYLSHGQKLCTLINFCKKNNRTVIAEMPDFVKKNSLKAVKFHLDKKNSDRYVRCLELLILAGLTEHEYFYFLLAELSLVFNKKEVALEYYKDAVKITDGDKDEEDALSGYKAEMRKNLPDEIRR
ncbi:MAG: hypothetical protein IJU55_01720 [Selenomonadaceae bacterium]|nr:hypothetical protein [Selenomonadaceae bacterium]